MRLRMFNDANSMARAAADQAAESMQGAIAERGVCRIVVATGASQFPFLDALTKMEIDWVRVEAFHLDEYAGMKMTHPASFRKMLIDRLISKTGIKKYHPVEGDAEDLAAAMRKLGSELTKSPIDVAFIGIGENGHIAFNDPPADFDTEEPYILVDLDEACRKQQVGEGWFANLSEVPTRAISMSPRQIMKAREILTVVPDRRKAEAVKASVESEITPRVPASILKRHPNTTVFLDRDSASLLSGEVREALERNSQAEIRA